MSVAVDVSDVREWTFERLSAFLHEPRDVDLDWRRFEIVDGLLVVSPTPSRSHERVVIRLGALLDAASPAGFAVVGSAGVGAGRSYRVTDVTVLTESAFHGADETLVGTDVLIAVEIESPSSITTDRITKPAQYARAGVRHYWRVELGPLRLVTYALRDGVYVETGSWDVSETAVITDPFDVTIDLATLLP